jgi:hypothetical protein
MLKSSRRFNSTQIHENEVKPMKNAFVVAVSVIVAFHCSKCLASEERVDRLIAAKSLKCQFTFGAAGKWKGDKIKIEKVSDDWTMYFDSIDLKNNKARLIGSVGATDVTAIPSLQGIHFLEQTDSGNIMLTTVFFDNEKGIANYIAVTSRHIALFGSAPMPQQYHGTL